MRHILKVIDIPFQKHVRIIALECWLPSSYVYGGEREKFCGVWVVVSVQMPSDVPF